MLTSDAVNISFQNSCLEFRTARITRRAEEEENLHAPAEEPRSDSAEDTPDD